VLKPYEGDCGGEEAFAAMLVETEQAGLIDEPEGSAVG